MAKVDPSANVKVDPVAGCVKVTLLMVVAVAAPKVGVVMVGEFNVAVVKVLLVNVSAPAKVAKVPEVGKVTEVVPVALRVCENAPLKVTLAAVDKVDPSANVKVDPVAGCVKVNLLMVVAVAAPKVGVVIVGFVSEGFVKVLLVNVSAPVKVAKVPEVGKVTVVAAVAVRVCENAPLKVTLPAVVKVDPSANVKVDPVAGWVKVNLLMVVAVAAPKVGVVMVGFVRDGFVKVLLVNVSAPVKVAKVPVVGKVTEVAPVAVKDCEKAPI